MRKNITLIITIAACALTAFAFWNLETPSHDEEEHHHSHEEDFIHFNAEQLQTHAIEIRNASSGQLTQIVRAPAKITINANRVTHVFPKVSGSVTEAYKNLGESVKANELLATLGSREMAEAKAEYLAAYNLHKLANGTYNREKNLYEKKITATQDFQNAENALGNSSIQLELARQKLYALGLNEQEIDELPDAAPHLLRVYEMRSPIAGKIIARHINPGELLHADHEAYIVADLSKLWVEINVFPQDRQHVKEGQSVTISSYNDQKAEGSIIYLSPIIDPDTRTSKAIAEIDNSSGQWLPGSFVNGELITDTINVSLLVPKEAVQNIDGIDTVFISAEDGFSVRQVKTGRSDERHCEIISGIAPGEAYACKNTFLLKAELKKDEAEHMD